MNESQGNPMLDDLRRVVAMFLLFGVSKFTPPQDAATHASLRHLNEAMLEDDVRRAVLSPGR